VCGKMLFGRHANLLEPESAKGETLRDNSYMRFGIPFTTKSGAKQMVS
jgi:hypothetical protein